MRKIFLLTPLALTLPTLAQDSADEKPILQVMEELESARDAKCHSSACRFENYVFGTPLNDEAREVRSELQKELVYGLWSAGAERARAAGRDQVTPADVQPGIEALLKVEEDGLGNVEVTFSGAEREEPVRLSQLRRSQYASIAYSLRAILAVQQDQLALALEPLLGIDEASTRLFKETLDTVTLSALGVADDTARAESRAEIDGSAFRAAWRTLIPQRGESASSAAPADPAARDRAWDVLRGIIAEKTKAYEKYNAIAGEEAWLRFAVNTERFYALYTISPKQDVREAFLAAFDQAMVEFAADVLALSSEHALEQGHALARADDAVHAVHVLTPHRVDTLEDVHFFPHLSPEERVTLEAYDCDSFRDLGYHWGYIERAMDAPGRPALAPDPFASEILAEGVSQYAVLVMRIAGDIARGLAESPALRASDLTSSVQLIKDRAEQNAATEAPSLALAGIASAPTRTARGGHDGQAVFADVTEASGLDFLHRSSHWLNEFRRERTAGPPTFSGGGIAAEDVDGDGDDDLLLVGGLGNALYLGDGQGGFTRSPISEALTWRRDEESFGEPRTPLIVDLDNDGRLDVLITYAGDPHRVYRNVSEGGELAFEDVTEKAGLGGSGIIGGPATVFDFDGDGLLDVYLAYFGNYLENAMPHIDRDNRNASPNRLFRNAGGMRFVDASEGSGTDDTGWCQAVSHTDFDRDGRQDLVVANDFGRNAMLRNLGGGKFENVARGLGMTNAFHSMNVGISDLNADDYPDIYISNIATLVKANKYVLPNVYTPMDFNYEAMATMIVKESDMLYMSYAEEGALRAYEASQDVERGSTSTGWAWDAEFFDFDHDGDDDLYVVNGTNDYNYYASINRAKTKEGEVVHQLLTHARESNVLFENSGGKLKNVSEGSGADLLMNSRSTAYLDFDGDGDLDVAVNNFHAGATMLRNDAEKAGHWLKVRLVGDPAKGSNPDAIGARLVLRDDAGLRVAREVTGGSGFLSMNPRTVHFGLGSAETADLTIVWPDGSVQEVTGLAADSLVTVRQADE